MPVFTTVGKRELLAKVTELPVSKSALTFFPFKRTLLVGLEGNDGASFLAKQVDMTAQKLMMAEGRRDEPGFFFLKSFPKSDFRWRDPARHSGEGLGLLEMKEFPQHCWRRCATCSVLRCWGV